jgi:hypothetical protein
MAAQLPEDLLLLHVGSYRRSEKQVLRSLRSHQDDILRSLRSHQDDNVCHSTPPASSMSRIAGSLTKI